MPEQSLFGGPSSLSFGGGSFANGGGFNFMDSLKGLGNFFNSGAGQGLGNLGSLALQGYGLNKSLGFAEDQLGLLKQQEGRAATAQNFQTGNSLALQLQTTTPGTPEHERIKEAIAQGSFEV